jgi:hypothetical protein
VPIEYVGERPYISKGLILYRLNKKGRVWQLPNTLTMYQKKDEMVAFLCARMVHVCKIRLLNFK